MTQVYARAYRFVRSAIKFDLLDHLEKWLPTQLTEGFAPLTRQESFILTHNQYVMGMPLTQFMDTA